MIKDTFRLQDTRRLVDCAMGRIPADYVICNGQWVNVQTAEIIPGTDIAVIDGRIAVVGPDASYCIGEHTVRIDAGGRYLVPGLLDAHMHVESTMLTVTQFVRAALPRGITGVFIDPHEIANVFGLQGVRLMVEESAQQPIHVFVQMPSCVPSAPGLETAGASIGPEEVAEAMTWPGIIGLGEMMNFSGVIHNDVKLHAELSATRRAGKIIGGHYPSPDLGLPFAGYAAGGPGDDHEGTRLEDALIRARQGMRVMMRYGSGWKDVASQVKALTQHHLNSRLFLLCTDDLHAETLVEEGHMDRAIRHTIDQGLDPITAIQMATLNTAEYFGVSREIGMIAPGRYADILMVTDLEDFRPDWVMARGEIAAQQGKLSLEIPEYDYPIWALRSIHMRQMLVSEDFRIRFPKGRPQNTAAANVIEIIEDQAPTRKIQAQVENRNGWVRADPARDLAKIALIERHNATGAIQIGLVHGFGLEEGCAIATTVAHDCHQMIVVGTNDEQMAFAANKLAQLHGGQIVIKNGEVIGLVELPIAGLMSNQPAEIVARQAASVLAGFRACGCRINNPNMQLSLLGLVVIPELRISDKGLVDVNQFKIISMFETG